MSIAEMKEKIVEKINQLTDEQALQEVLQILVGEQNEENDINAMTHKARLFDKHDGLLKRLS